MKKILVMVCLLISSVYGKESHQLSGYERHFPEAIYKHCIDHYLIDSAKAEIHLEKESKQGSRPDILRFELVCNEPEGVLMTYYPAEIVENFGGIQIQFQDQIFCASAIFDAEGRGYVCYAEDFDSLDKMKAYQQSIISFLLDRVLSNWD